MDGALELASSTITTLNALHYALQPANHWHKPRYQGLPLGCTLATNARCIYRLIAWASLPAACFSVSSFVCYSYPEAVKPLAAAAAAAANNSTLLPSPSTPCTLPSSFMLLLSHQYSIRQQSTPTRIQSGMARTHADVHYQCSNCFFIDGFIHNLLTYIHGGYHTYGPKCTCCITCHLPYSYGI